MATLVSPGVSVTVIDESNYAPTGPGTVPFILLATAQDKNSTAGGILFFFIILNLLLFSLKAHFINLLIS
jgi:hypothetical protein